MTPAVAERNRAVEDFDFRAKDFERLSAWVNEQSVADGALSLLGGHELGDVADIGGGTGALAYSLALKRRVSSLTVVDPSTKMLSRVPRGIAIRRADLKELSLEGSNFDTVLMRQVLHYMEDPANELRRLTWILRPRGRLYLGQIVAPGDAAADWMLSVSQALSTARRHLWSEQAFNQLLSRDFKILNVRGGIYRDSVKSWLARRVNDVDPDHVIAMAREMVTPKIQAELDLDPRDESLPFTAHWYHAIVASRHA